MISDSKNNDKNYDYRQWKGWKQTIKVINNESEDNRSLDWW